ncbi:MAG: hypothetical protein MJD61_19010, partial [Proteobacteria bacterium]|nr:hypothetical protein [Pseudomonadota bacterium]
MRLAPVSVLCAASLLCAAGPVEAQHAGQEDQGDSANAANTRSRTSRSAQGSLRPSGGASLLQDDGPRLQPPRVELPVLDSEAEADESSPAAPPARRESLAGPEPPGTEAQAASPAGASEPAGVPATTQWTAPQSVLTLHGYMRARGEVLNTLWLGRHPTLPGVPDPFTRFKPLERLRGQGLVGAGLCKPDNNIREGPAECDADTLGYANLRLRLAPEIHLSEDVRVKMMVDVLDNLVAGSTPGSFYAGQEPAVLPALRDPFVSTALPPGPGFNVGEGIVARRAWAEVRNRDLGELRFGRMPNAWGLGMVAHAGN